MSGVPVDSVVIGAYGLMGAVVAVTAIFRPPTPAPPPPPWETSWS